MGVTINVEAPTHVSTIDNSFNTKKYRSTVCSLIVLFSFFFAIFGIVTIIVWGAPFRTAANYKQTTCYLSSVITKNASCAYRNCYNYKCTSLYDNCYNINGLYKYIDKTNVSRTFTISSEWLLWKNEVSDYLTDLYNLNNTTCWYNYKNYIDVTFKNPKLFDIYVTALVFSALTGISVIGLTISITARCLSTIHNRTILGVKHPPIQKSTPVTTQRSHRSNKSSRSSSSYCSDTGSISSHCDSGGGHCDSGGGCGDGGGDSGGCD